jgi:VanZ family protein
MSVLATVSLIRLGNVPNLGISFADKIFHFGAYFVLAFLWVLAFFYNFNYKKNKAIIYAMIISIVFGILIEVLQGMMTEARSSDIYDAVANTIGVLLAALVLSFINVKHIKKE